MHCTLEKEPDSVGEIKICGRGKKDEFKEIGAILEVPFKVEATNLGNKEF